MVDSNVKAFPLGRGMAERLMAANRPPKFVRTDCERAAGRYFAALLAKTASAMQGYRIPPLVASDVANYSDMIRTQDIGGIEIVTEEDLFAFIEKVTGHPLAWIASWQMCEVLALTTGADLPDFETMSNHLELVTDLTHDHFKE